MSEDADREAERKAVENMKDILRQDRERREADAARQQAERGRKN